MRSREGVKAVAISLAVLGLTAAAQLAIFLVANSVALLADLVHNFGDALTAVPSRDRFLLRSFRGEKLAGLAVVLAIFLSACVALYETIQRFLHPEDLTHLWVLAGAGVIGFIGNELAARHPPSVRVAGFPSPGARSRMATTLVPTASSPSESSASAIAVALGASIGDPVIGLVITLAIFKITWDSWRLVSTTEPGAMIDHEH